ncbi:adhesion G-protein coupled receptor G5-like isoform X1 [Conger conger]|uniref:adhesion G-protein coupled receptor G5-like isoform X1 n=1 Tax=Conger conger TaxID=82655 RepID=UPI002A5A6813|nr:adhesion G-protein coupled receptor G5-like isoform X1 [Conger conger]
MVTVRLNMVTVRLNMFTFRFYIVTVRFNMFNMFTGENRGDSIDENLGVSKEQSLEDRFMKMNEIIQENKYTAFIRFMEELERELECTTFPGGKYSITKEALLAHLYRAPGNFQGLTISANHANRSVHVYLPEKILQPKEDRTIVFCMITASEMFERQNLTVLYGNVVGVSISGKKLKGLMDRIKITFSLQGTSPLQGKLPRCHYLNFSTNSFHSDGCITHWSPGEEQVVCSCDHLTYFAVLLVTPEISERDQNILTYITLIGCSISLIFLVITLLMYLCHRKMLADTTLKIHLNLVVALVLLNVHFLPSQLVASLSVYNLCVYLAVMIHYSLLATFTWTALEGFHLYLLLIRVFNIYVRRYLLKLALVGWGLPAVAVIIILIINKDIYQRVTLHSSDNNTTSSQICYLQDSTVQVFNIAFCGLVWAFTMIMLALTCKLMLRRDRMPGGNSRRWKDVCTVLGISSLLGVTWGLVFCSFGGLPTPGLYLFCILNSLQGFFVSLWMLISKQRAGAATSKDSQATRSTDMQTDRYPKLAAAARPGKLEADESAL